MKTLKIGMVGAGFNGNFHRRALQSVRGADLAGVYALKGAEELAAAAQADELGDCQVYNSIAELCEAVDVVGIFIPNYVRLDTMSAIVEAVKAGAELKGIICEKPLARNCAEAAQMVAMAKETGVPTAYFENQIHMPAVTKARAQLADVEAAVGPIQLTRSAEEHGGPHEPWFWDPTRQGGGVWCDMGCHSAAVGMHMLTPQGKPPDFLEPVSISAEMALLKWGREPWVSKLRERGVDYAETPAEDYATVVLKFRNPETGQIVVAQATDSWMYDAPGLRLSMEAVGPGYGYGVNTLTSPVGIFISDTAAQAVGDAEMALEKSQASRGALVLMEDEAGTYGYCNEWRNALAEFRAGHDAMLNFAYGARITDLVMGAYYAHESSAVLEVTGWDDLANIVAGYVPAIQQGRGWDVLKR